MPNRPILVLVGGFLGAGKTTLLLRAARLLHERGMRAAIITNDQGAALVDTRMTTASGFDAGEIAGACFCCRFGDFVAAAQSLMAVRPDVILAEPVGSCMDLSATVLQPLKQHHAAQFRLAPFSVLVDPRRAAEFTQPDADPQLAYLFHNQLAEADLVLYTKSDLQTQPPATSHQPLATGDQPPAPIAPAYVASWAANTEALGYVDTHLTRLVKTLEITPPGGAEDRILEMGAYLQITPALRSKLGYGCVRGCYYGPAGKIDRRSATSTEGESFDCEIDLFNAEKDPFPYPDGHFATVLCCELIEHLTEDPMHLMSEINRIVKPGGHLVLTTPNIGSLRGIAAILEGYHPGVFTAYIRPRADGEVEARHNREYAPKEIERLLLNSGFTVTLLETGPFRQTPRPEEGWVLNLLERFDLPKDLRGDDIYAVGRKTGAVRERYPDWLYA